MSRVLGLCLLAILLFGCTDRVHPTPGGVTDPVTVVRQLYRPAGHDRGAAYSRRLEALYQAALKNAKVRDIPVSGLDFDFAVNGQEVEPDTYRSAQVALLRQGDGRAEVRASFRNRGDQELRYSLVLEGGRWRIDEVTSTTGDGWRWSDMLVQGAVDQ